MPSTSPPRSVAECLSQNGLGQRQSAFQRLSAEHWVKRMVKRSVLTLVFAASVWGAVPGRSPAQPWSIWQLTQVKDGHFSILMPGESDRTTHPLTVLGTPAQKTVVSAEQWQHQAQYQVSWTDLPQHINLANVRQQAFVFEDMLTHFSLERGGQLLSETDLKLAGHPGKQYQLSGWIDGESYRITYRAFLIGSRFFQVSVAMPERSAPGLAGSTRGFLKSFRLQ